MTCGRNLLTVSSYTGNATFGVHLQSSVASRGNPVLHICVLSGVGIAVVSGSVSDGTLAVLHFTFSCNGLLWKSPALYRATSSGALFKRSADARPCCSICANRLTSYRSQVLKARVPCSRANEMYRFCRKDTNSRASIHIVQDQSVRLFDLTRHLHGIQHFSY